MLLADRSLSDPDTNDDNPGHAPKAHPLLPNAPGALRERLGTSRSMHGANLLGMKVVDW